MERLGAQGGHAEDRLVAHLDLQVVLRHAAPAEAQGEEARPRGASGVPTVHHSLDLHRRN